MSSAVRSPTRTRSWPARLKRTDCSLVSDGAAALVIADPETAQSMPRSVAFRTTTHANDFLPMSKRDILKFEGCAAGLASGPGSGRHRR